MSETTDNSDVRCPACQTLNGPFESFCRNCGAPIGVTATLLPTSTIQAEGHLFRKALDRPPSRVVLIGIWIMFLPAFVVGVYAALRLIRNGHGLADFFFFWVFVGLTYLAFVILYRPTKKYFAARHSE